MSSPADSPLDPSPSSPYPLERADSDPDTRPMLSSASPSTSTSEFAPLHENGQRRLSRSLTTASNFVSSPLNPNPPAQPSIPPSLFPARAAPSRQSMVFNRVPSEESQALASQRPSHNPHRASMILYRLADDAERALTPPNANRHSMLSNSGDSVFTVSYDSKYPSGAHTPHTLVAYPFDPSSHINTPEDDDALHDPSDDSPLGASSGIPIRGLLNVGVLVLVILALLCLFIFYPIWHYVIQGKGS